MIQDLCVWGLFSHVLGGGSAVDQHTGVYKVFSASHTDTYIHTQGNRSFLTPSASINRPAALPCLRCVCLSPAGPPIPTKASRRVSLMQTCRLHITHSQSDWGSARFMWRGQRVSPNHLLVWPSLCCLIPAVIQYECGTLRIAPRYKHQCSHTLIITTTQQKRDYYELDHRSCTVMREFSSNPAVSHLATLIPLHCQNQGLHQETGHPPLRPG